MSSDEDEEIKCSYCGHNFISKGILKKHIKNEHHPERMYGNRTYNCFLCGIYIVNIMSHFKEVHTCHILDLVHTYEIEEIVRKDDYDINEGRICRYIHQNKSIMRDFIYSNALEYTIFEIVMNMSFYEWKQLEYMRKLIEKQDKQEKLLCALVDKMNVLAEIVDKQQEEKKT